MHSGWWWGLYEEKKKKIKRPLPRPSDREQNGPVTPALSEGLLNSAGAFLVLGIFMRGWSGLIPCNDFQHEAVQ